MHSPKRRPRDNEIHEANHSLDDLCTDVLKVIISFLNNKAKLVLGCVNRLFRRLVLESLNNVETLDFAEIPSASITTLHFLAARAPNIRYVDCTALFSFNIHKMKVEGIVSFLQSLPAYTRGDLSVKLPKLMAQHYWEQWEPFARSIPHCLTSADILYTDTPSKIEIYDHLLRNGTRLESIFISWTPDTTFPLFIHHTSHLRSLVVKGIKLDTHSQLLKSIPTQLTKFGLADTCGPGMLQLLEVVGQCKFITSLKLDNVLMWQSGWQSFQQFCYNHSACFQNITRLHLGLVTSLSKSTLLHILSVNNTPRLMYLFLSPAILSEELLCELEQIRDLSLIRTRTAGLPLEFLHWLTPSNGEYSVPLTFAVFARRFRCSLRIARAVLLQASGGIETAHQLYSEARVLDPYCLEAYTLDAAQFVREGKLEQALAIYRQARSIAPTVCHLALEEANILATMGHHDSAIAVYKDILAIYPRCGLALLSMAECLRQLRRYDEALLSYDELIGWDPVYSMPYLAAALTCRGATLIMMRRLRDAEVSLDQAIMNSPVSSLAALSWNLKAVARYHLGQYPEAIRFCDEGLKLAPYIATLHQTKGACLMALGNPSDALRCFEAAICLNPNDPLPRKSAMSALMSLGRFHEALQCRDALAAMNEFESLCNVAVDKQLDGGFRT